MNKFQQDSVQVFAPIQSWITTRLEESKTNDEEISHTKIIFKYSFQCEMSFLRDKIDNEQAIMKIAKEGLVQVFQRTER